MTWLLLFAFILMVFLYLSEVKGNRELKKKHETSSKNKDWIGKL